MPHSILDRQLPLRPCVALLLLLAGFSRSALAVQELPNIVVIVADDLGWADVSFHGGQIRTPHIDRIATEGVQLDRFYVCPVCSPTRAGLMTGRYPIRYGLMRAVIPPWRKGGLDTAEVTLAAALADAGYTHRGVFGKWHLGHSHVKYHPLRRGFTRFMGHYNGAIDYFAHTREGELDWHEGYDTNYDKGYSTDLIASAAADFIRRYAPEKAPYFCYVPFNAPHSPLQAKPGDLAKYSELAKTRPRLRQGNGRNYGATGRGESARQTLAAMIAAMDDGIGELLRAIDETGEADNTLVWFFSDNGGVGTGDNRPLRGAKGTTFEGGIRVAAALRWPSRVAAGGKITVPLANIDVFPTVMGICRVKETPGKPFDGLNVLDQLMGRRAYLDRDVYAYIGQAGEDKESIALIEPQYKLVVNGQRLDDAETPDSARQMLLFNIATDPFEKTNVARRQARVVQRMLTKLKRFRSLQPPNAVLPYASKKEGFVAPREWKIAPGELP